MKNKEFVVHKLNEMGMARALGIAVNFDILLTALTVEVPGQGALCPEGRELALVRTKLEEACFFAQKSMAGRPENQEGYVPPGPKTKPESKDK